MHFINETDAPALARGLAILEWLNREGASSLDRIATTTGWPKASVLRLLRTLETMKTVTRDPVTKRWRPGVRMVVDNDERVVRERCAASLIELCERSGQTAECYRFDGARMVMVDRAEPERVEVTVRARLGFVRDIEEADAVCQVALAWMPQELWPSRHFRYIDRKRTPLAREHLRGVVEKVRREGVAADLGVNSNGVRRFAAPVVDENGALIAAIGIAHGGAMETGRGDQRFLSLVRDAAARLAPDPVIGARG